MSPTPETSAILDSILERDGELTERNAPAKLVQLAKEAERTRLDIAELNQRLIERAESIVTQAAKIDETWREKLRIALKERDTAHADYAVLETVYGTKCAELRDQEAITQNYRACITAALELAKAPTHHPQPDAPFPKPLTPVERIVALGDQRDTLRHDLTPLLAAIRAYAEFNGGCGHHPDDCPQEAEECQIVAALNREFKLFTTKHPTP